MTLSDTDGVVKAGTDVMVTITPRNLNTQDATATVQYVRVSGEIDHPWSTGPSPTDADDETDGHQYRVVIPEGTTEGVYTVSTLAWLSAGETDPTKRLRTSAEITVRDPGVNAAAVQLSLANEENDDPKTTANEQAEETGTTGASGEIWLKVAVTNSLGSKANDGGLNSLTVIAPGADIEIHVPDPGDVLNHTRAAVTEATGPDSASVDDPQDVMYVKITKKGAPPKPGSIDVYALLIGSDGAPRSDTLTLNFTGSAADLELGAAPNISVSDQTEFTISASDAGGNVANVNRVMFKVANADGDPVGQSVIKVEQKTQGTYNDVDGVDTQGDNNSKQVTGVITSGAKVPAGEYTITVSIVGVADSEATTTVTVVGRAASVDVEASAISSDTIGDVITVTASVNDEDGSGLPDNTPVMFNVSTGTGLAAIGTGHGEGTDADPAAKTKDGVATVKYAVVGAGTSVISATSGAATGVVVVVSTAGGSEAMTEEEASVACLSTLSGFSTWSCGVDSSASEIFGLVSGRGATALHLWNGSAWVRYSVVDGTMVPGSSDFMVTQYDTLYISN